MRTDIGDAATRYKSVVSCTLGTRASTSLFASTGVRVCESFSSTDAGVWGTRASACQAAAHRPSITDTLAHQCAYLYLCNEMVILIATICYAMSGTDIAYGAVSLRACYAMSGTEIA
eukprot:1898013-Rhodomonas_salina.3